MVKKKVFFLFFFIIIITMFLLPIHIVHGVSISNIASEADGFVNSGKANASNALNTTVINNTSTLIYNTFLILGTSLAVIVGGILGLQFITGSVEQKVKVKESIIPFIIGCVVIFGAFGIWRLVILLLR